MQKTGWFFLCEYTNFITLNAKKEKIELNIKINTIFAKK